MLGFMDGTGAAIARAETRALKAYKVLGKKRKEAVNIHTYVCSNFWQAVVRLSVTTSTKVHSHLPRRQVPYVSSRRDVGAGTTETYPENGSE